MSSGMRDINKDLLKEIDGYLTNAINYGDRWSYQYYDTPDETDKVMAERYFQLTWASLISLLESNNHNFLLKQVLNDYEEYKKNPLDTKMGPEEPYLVWGDKIYQYIKILKTLYIPNNENENNRNIIELKAVIKRCQTYVTNREIFAWLPCKENDIHNRIEPVLQVYFPDIHRWCSISTPIKNFEPDTYSLTLKTLIEYKYLDTREKAKVILDGILTDISGYQCTEYENIIFVVYETERFYTESDWESTLDNLKVKTKLGFVLLYGIPPTNEDKAMKESYENKKKIMKDKRQQDDKASN
ncbi:MAG: hypothetical protein A2Y10_15350 [Planctomycetes bacterium GWF2_41_51]|nr:MAG: hypothetical protein A2Y10_15350 [Planctomycetes bacterium GWF2_41_51]HBG26977.1 hypothetical protein [Phycisphaerales bacterium]